MRKSPGVWRQRLELTVLVFELVGIPLAFIGVWATYTELQNSSEQTQLAREAILDTREIAQRATLFDNGADLSERFYALSALIGMGRVPKHIPALTCEGANGCHVSGFDAVGSPPKDQKRLSVMGADWSGAQIITTEVRDIDFRDVILKGTFLANAIFQNVGFWDPDFTSTNFAYTEFRDGEIYRGEWNKTDLRGANFLQFDISEANLSGAEFCPKYGGDLNPKPFATMAEAKESRCLTFDLGTFVNSFYFTDDPPLGIGRYQFATGIWACQHDVDEFINRTPEGFKEARCTQWPAEAPDL